VLSRLALLAPSDVAKDVEILVLRHEVARYADAIHTHVDVGRRAYLSAVSRLPMIGFTRSPSVRGHRWQLNRARDPAFANH
jgi:hypothetical protein